MAPNAAVLRTWMDEAAMRCIELYTNILLYKSAQGVLCNSTESAFTAEGISGTPTTKEAVAFESKSGATAATSTASTPVTSGIGGSNVKIAAPVTTTTTETASSTSATKSPTSFVEVDGANNVTIDHTASLEARQAQKQLIREQNGVQKETKENGNVLGEIPRDVARGIDKAFEQSAKGAVGTLDSAKLLDVEGSGKLSSSSEVRLNEAAIPERAFSEQKVVPARTNSLGFVEAQNEDVEDTGSIATSIPDMQTLHDNVAKAFNDQETPAMHNATGVLHEAHITSHDVGSRQKVHMLFSILFCHDSTVAIVEIHPKGSE